jgi:anti-sigma factor RsiW
MNEHAFVRDRLTLAAAGALDPAEQRRMEEHLRHCAGCRAEFEAWGRLGGALEALPTPQAPPGLLERTVRQLEARAAVRAERRYSRSLLAWVTVLGWAGTLLTWPLFQWLGGVVDLPSQSVTEVWIGYIVVSWMMTVVVAGLLAQRRRGERTI